MQQNLLKNIKNIEYGLTLTQRRPALPGGLQMVGRWWEEASVLRTAAVFESAAQWAHRRPPV
jgi:Asp-tRNA(Asn)/Glu-tRNA(Gln) amidotransferase A subunit family amidase